MPVEGNIVLCSNERLCIQLKNNNETYLLSPKNFQIKSKIDRLSEGDYIVGHGQINVESNNIVLSNLLMVGLNRLYGTWISKSGDIYKFDDYLTMEKCVAPCFEDSPRQIISYQITPGRGASWLLLMMNFDIQTGILSFSEDKSLRIDFNNSKRHLMLFPVDSPFKERTFERVIPYR